eukprot:m.33667 g.33667  ORF g.33667 m.33667 type:complete len:412 (+) comp8584_c0_seq1:91-1326(+)
MFFLNSLGLAGIFLLTRAAAQTSDDVIHFGPPEAVERLETLYQPHPLFEPKIEPLPSSMFGFYIHAFADVAATAYSVKRLNEVFPDSPVYVISDGGYDFSPMCKIYKCIFRLCPPANDRWHPLPFVRRFWDAAIALKTDYIIMLEPDNTIHRPIYIQPDKDAGGLEDANPHYHNELIYYVQELGRKHRPKFNWTFHGSGLAGGAYFRTAAVLDAFSDAAVADINWTIMEALESRRVYSSDFAMPVLLGARGYRYEPWRELTQHDLVGDKVTDQPMDAAFAHYGRGVKGGKPTYNLNIVEDISLLHIKGKYAGTHVTCQECYNISEYKAQWGDQCTNIFADRSPKPSGEDAKRIKEEIYEMAGGKSRWGEVVQQIKQSGIQATIDRKKKYFERDRVLYREYPDDYDPLEYKI